MRTKNEIKSTNAMKNKGNCFCTLITGLTTSPEKEQLFYSFSAVSFLARCVIKACNEHTTPVPVAGS